MKIFIVFYFIRKEMEDNAEKRGKLEVAKNLINMKLPIEQIVLATGLTEEEINKISLFIQGSFD